jgi:ssDNA-binding Zn-finger/Zn-ribbon topoisomerase 1
MESVFIVVAILVVFFFVVQQRYLKQDELKDSAYKKKGPLLNMQESAFYNALVTAVGQHGIVLAKVNMTHIATPLSTNKKQWFIANNRIAKSYFDFVVCDPRSLHPRVVIELDNGKELDKGKIERQKLLMHVCKSASIPLIGASIKHSYQVGRLRRLLAAHIDLIEPDKEVRFCKRCGSPMVIKTASQGEHKGRRFFTCSRQPHCTYTENYNVVFEEDA